MTHSEKFAALTDYMDCCNDSVFAYLRDNKDRCATDVKYHQVAKEMLMSVWLTRQIKHGMMEHHGKELATASLDNAWYDALHAANMKWIVFLRLKDEVQDAHMDIEAAKVAKEHGNEVIATEMKAMAKTRTANAEKLNARYASLPYTHGTAAEQAEWDKEYAAVIAHHKENVATLA